jgi:hypothetical protein
LSSDFPKELKLSILGTIRCSTEAEGSASFGGVDLFEGDPLTHGIQNGEIGGEKSWRLVVEGAVRFPAEVNAIPEALGWDDGAASGMNSTFPKVNSALHFARNCSEIGGRIGNLGEVSVINEAVTSHTKLFSGKSGLQVDAGALRTK